MASFQDNSTRSDLKLNLKEDSKKLYVIRSGNMFVTKFNYNQFSDLDLNQIFGSYFSVSNKNLNLCILF